MTWLNYTWPGRLHLIGKDRFENFYFTLWLFRHRLHYCRGFLI